MSGSKWVEFNIDLPKLGQVEAVMIAWIGFIALD